MMVDRVCVCVLLSPYSLCTLPRPPSCLECRRYASEALSCLSARRFPCTVMSWNVTDPVSMQGSWVRTVLQNETHPLGFSAGSLAAAAAGANTLFANELQWNWAAR